MMLTKYIKGDRIIWAVILILFVISLLAVYSSTGSIAYKERSGDTMYYLLRQLKFIFLGLGAMIIVHHIPYRVFSKWWVSLLVMSVAIFLLVLTIFRGESRNEAARWLLIPGTGWTFQPSELAKVALILYISRVLSINQNNISDFKGVFLKLTIAIVVVCALILPANLSTSAIVFVIAFILMFIGRVPIRYLGLLVIVGIAGLSLFLLVASSISEETRITTWKNRVEVFMKGDGDNYQAEQAKVAIVRGGILPNGPGSSTQRIMIPHPYSDFIFAIIIEEYGSLLGGLLLIFLYLWLLFRAGILVRRSRSTFAAFLAVGLSLGLVFQAFVNMGVSVGLLPVTGQTLPLVSMGGTSIVITGIALGMILSISWGIRKEMELESAEGSADTASADVMDHDDPEHENQEAEMPGSRSDIDNDE